MEHKTHQVNNTELFDLYYTADRKVIEEISKYTWGNTHRTQPPSNLETHKQMLVSIFYGACKRT